MLSFEILNINLVTLTKRLYLIYKIWKKIDLDERYYSLTHNSSILFLFAAEIAPNLLENCGANW